jgi:sensor c-di-GMP phosphodiesterase-like protein
MMSTLKQRVLVTLAATLFAVLLGLLGGYLAGRAVMVHIARLRLDAYANHIKATRDEVVAENRALLAAMNSSQLPLCSDAAIAFMRRIVYNSKYMKDAGSVRDGKVVCSAVLGRPEIPLAMPKPDFLRPDGTELYADPELFRIGDHAAITVQLGSSYMVYNPFLQRDLESPTMHYTASAYNSQTKAMARFLGEDSGASQAILTTEGPAQVGDILYATRCSPQYYRCMTAYVSIHDVAAGHRTQLLEATGLGGLTGGCFGFLLSFLYRRNQSMERQLRRAIAADELRMVYQPIVDLATGQIAGAEALVRWTNEDSVAVGPDVFVKLAEERGFVGEITRLVVRHVLRDFGPILRAHPAFKLSVNIAAADLSDPEFLPMLNTALDDAGVGPQSISIEITEGSTVCHSVAIETIRQLRQRGHAVHIDDFGTGYSSLSYLRDLAVDAIKIDRSFTQAIGTEAVTVVILPQIMAIAEALNLQVIVEGVETKDQAQYFASTSQPTLGQGWFFGRPVSVKLFHGLLEQENKAHIPADAA